jgi:RecA/RadA recombinase
MEVQQMAETIVINCFAGPGAGKTTAAFYIACELKKRGYVTEYVPEYAKELVWDKNFTALDGNPEHQRELLLEQKHRLDRLNGQVEFIVTDSPLLLNHIYLDKEKADAEEYLKDVLQMHREYHNFNLFITRDTRKFETEGRLQNLAESKEIDTAIKELLDNCKEFYGTYYHNTLSFTVINAIKTFDRYNPGVSFNKKMGKGR